jgi:glycosyltransferase involved in cell wall biosynthesis
VNDPLVSVVIPFLNAQRFLDEAVQSVLAQTYGHWELILVDDGSTDEGSLIARRYAGRLPHKVRCVEHEGHGNLGMAASRNAGIRSSRGPCLAFLDADDVWFPNKLERQLALLASNPDAGMVAGCSQYWHSWTARPEDLGRDYVREVGVRTDWLAAPPILMTLIYPLGTGVSAPPSDLLLRRDVVERIDGFQEDFRGIYQLYEDQCFLTKVYLESPVYLSSECWTRYRIHDDSCVATVTARGHYERVRLRYLRWLENYLVQRNVRDTDIWTATRAALAQLDGIDQRDSPD